MRPDRPTVAVIVLNWNGAADTLECLRSLRRSHLPLHVIVVDNDSSDDSVRQVRDSELADTLLEAGSNKGYAGGNNLGIRHAIQRGFSTIAVLNNDTIVNPEAFGALSAHLVAGEHRALSPDVRYFHDPSRSWFAGGVVDRGWPRHLQESELPSDDGPLRPSECLSGCCIVARLETWQRVGLFDPAYFLIFEDSDWSLRARGRDVRLYVACDSVITHKVSRSFATGPSSLLASFYFIRNGLVFERRYAPRYLPRFFLRWLVRPTLGALLRGSSRRELMFRWLGVLAFVLRARGPAPRAVNRLSDVLTR